LIDPFGPSPYPLPVSIGLKSTSAVIWEYPVLEKKIGNRKERKTKHLLKCNCFSIGNWAYWMNDLQLNNSNWYLA
jgi:hypothetical protein